MIKYFFTNSSDGNLSYALNDNKHRVLQNRLNLYSKYKIKMDNVIYMNQTHGCNIEVVTSREDNYIKDCDAVITNDVNLPLMVMVADCIPVLIYDEEKKVICAVHAGRNGTFLKIVKKTVLQMIEKFGCEVENIRVNMGPSIQKCCYEVSSELEITVINSFGRQFTKNRFIDLQGINKKQLLEMGLNSNNINISTICTRCSNKNYFSYRADKSCGRFIGVITIDTTL